MVGRGSLVPQSSKYPAALSNDRMDCFLRNESVVGRGGRAENEEGIYLRLVAEYARASTAEIVSSPVCQGITGWMPDLAGGVRRQIRINRKEIHSFQIVRIQHLPCLSCRGIRCAGSRCGTCEWIWRTVIVCI